MKRLGLSFLCLTLFGCTVGPNYHRPAVAVPPQWKESVQAQTDQWWKAFHDEELNRLVERAVAANYDLQTASVRVQEARASAGLAKSAYQPQVDVGAGASRFREIGIGLVQGPTGINATEFPYETNDFSVNSSLSWEIDLFGRIKRSVEAARDDLAASEADRRSVLVSLLGDVAQYYSQLRGDQLRLDIAQKNIATAQDTLDLTKARFAGGQATYRDVAQAEGDLESVRSQVPTLNTAIQVSIHRLSVLLGKPPGDLETELSTPGALPPVPPEVPTGLPSDMLERRPDIQRAEFQLAAATARVGEAKADYFPSFTLVGSAGRQATQLHDLSLSFGNYFNFGPSVSLPVFTGGRIRSNVKIQDARMRESALQYQSTVLRALEETENSLVSYANEQDRRDRIAAAAKADETSFELAHVQYKAGQTDFLTVLDAQRQLFVNQDLLAQSQTNVTTDLIQLYRALGGGWSISPAAN